jgi:hypothetical protein
MRTACRRRHRLPLRRRRRRLLLLRHPNLLLLAFASWAQQTATLVALLLHRQ